MTESIAARSLEERFWSKVDRSGGFFACWPWTAHRDPAGYGRFGIGTVVAYAHRVAYEMLVGPIPEGLAVDHVKARGCVTRACVNPSHLEPVTPGENTRRGGLHGWAATHALAAGCANGHEFDGHDGRQRTCSICTRRVKRDSARRHRARAAA